MMKKLKILTKPTQVSNVRLDDLDYDTQTPKWEVKAERLRARRWRKLRHQAV
ncbi:MAG TPA: hypothetical protein VMY99_04705 [Nevskiaceae bacterium]|nr:hypothetical protein [Nevskiaceae bacterium]